MKFSQRKIVAIFEYKSYKFLSISNELIEDVVVVVNNVPFKTEFSCSLILELSGSSLNRVSFNISSARGITFDGSLTCLANAMPYPLIVVTPSC